MTMEIAGDRPPRYDKTARHRRARACPSPCTDRGGQAPALRLTARLGQNQNAAEMPKYGMIGN